jgi:hypothetical protein
MTSQPPAGRPTDRVRLGIAGLGAVAQAVHLPLLERLRDTYSIDAIADLSPALTGAIGERYRVDEDRRFATVEELVAAPDLDAVAILTSGSHARPSTLRWMRGSRSSPRSRLPSPATRWTASTRASRRRPDLDSTWAT